MNASSKSDNNSKAKNTTNVTIQNVNIKTRTPLLRECKWGQLCIDTFIYYDVAGGGLNKIWDSLVDGQERLFVKAGLEMEKTPSFANKQGIPTLPKFCVTFGTFVFGLIVTVFFVGITSETAIIIGVVVSFLLSIVIFLRADTLVHFTKYFFAKFKHRDMSESTLGSSWKAVRASAGLCIEVYGPVLLLEDFKKRIVEHIDWEEEKDTYLEQLKVHQSEESSILYLMQNTHVYGATHNVHSLESKLHPVKYCKIDLQMNNANDIMVKKLHNSITNVESDFQELLKPFNVGQRLNLEIVSGNDTNNIELVLIAEEYTNERLTGWKYGKILHGKKICNYERFSNVLIKDNELLCILIKFLYVVVICSPFVMLIAIIVLILADDNSCIEGDPICSCVLETGKDAYDIVQSKVPLLGEDSGDNQNANENTDTSEIDMSKFSESVTLSQLKGIVIDTSNLTIKLEMC